MVVGRLETLSGGIHRNLTAILERKIEKEKSPDFYFFSEAKYSINKEYATTFFPISVFLHYTYA
jgi:hypothetical protein